MKRTFKPKLPTMEDRDRMYLTRTELAAKIGVSTISVWRWETGRAVPRPRDLRAWRKALAMEVGA